MNAAQDDTSTETLQQGEVVAVMLPPSLFLQITQQQNDTNSNAAGATGIVFTFYDSAVLFPLGNGTNSSDNDDILIMVGTPVIGADIAGLEVIELAEPFTILLRLNNEVT